jgi:hypothetical protein
VRSEIGRRVLGEGAREAGEDPGEAEAEAGDGAVGVRRALAADGLHGLDEEAEAAHRRHVERQRRGREGQRHQQLQHRRHGRRVKLPFARSAAQGQGRGELVAEGEVWCGSGTNQNHWALRVSSPLRRRCTPGKGEERAMA